MSHTLHSWQDLCLLETKSHVWSSTVLKFERLCGFLFCKSYLISPFSRGRQIQWHVRICWGSTCTSTGLVSIEEIHRSLDLTRICIFSVADLKIVELTHFDSICNLKTLTLSVLLWRSDSWTCNWWTYQINNQQKIKNLKALPFIVFPCR